MPIAEGEVFGIVESYWYLHHLLHVVKILDKAIEELNWIKQLKRNIAVFQTYLFDTL